MARISSGGLMVPFRGAMAMVGHCESPAMIVWRSYWILTGCGSRTAQQIHHYSLLCSWFYQIFLKMFFHCHPGDVVNITHRPLLTFVVAGGPLVLRMCLVARTRQDKQTSKRATNKHVERPLIKRPIRRSRQQHHPWLGFPLGG